MTLLSDRSGDAALEARLRAEYGLDRPLWRQFGTYVAGIASRRLRPLVPLRQHAGDRRDRARAPGEPAPGRRGAAHRRPPGRGPRDIRRAPAGTRSWDTAVVLLLVAGTSIPNFALAAFLVYLLSIRLGWLPVAGWGTLSQAVLPVLLLAIPPTAYIARLVRTYMLEVLQQDYIRTARAKGLRRRLVVYRHALRNMLVPLLTTIGIILGGPPVRHLRHRDAVQHSRARASGHPVDLRPRLPGDDGHRPPVHVLLRGPEPRGGPPLRRHRSANSPGCRPGRTRVTQPGTALAPPEAARSGRGVGLLAALPAEPQRAPGRRAGRPGAAGGGGWPVARALPVRRHGPPGGVGRALAGAPPGRGRARAATC